MHSGNSHVSNTYKLLTIYLDSFRFIHISHITDEKAPLGVNVVPGVTDNKVVTEQVKDKDKENETSRKSKKYLCTVTQYIYITLITFRLVEEFKYKKEYVEEETTEKSSSYHSKIAIS